MEAPEFQNSCPHPLLEPEMGTCWGWLGVERPVVFSISPRQGLLFFLSCLLGSSSSLFFLQKGRKANLEHTQLTCHRWWLGPALGIGSLTVKRHRVGEPLLPHRGTRKRRENARCLSVQALQAPPFFPPAHASLKGLLASAHTISRLEGPAVQWPPPLSVHLFLLLNAWGSIPPQGEESLDQQRSMQQPCGRQKQEEGERALSILDPRQLCGSLRKAWCFSTQTSVVLVVTVYTFSLALNIRAPCGMVCSWSVCGCLMSVVQSYHGKALDLLKTES